MLHRRVLQIPQSVIVRYWHKAVLHMFEAITFKKL
jgi:hypothetical protein